MVTPFVGVWIEIEDIENMLKEALSLPSWECGLKSHQQEKKKGLEDVTPFVGVWIEMFES